MLQLNFSQWLRKEFVERRRRNPRYSLRAFAASFRVDHSTLSQVMSGRRAANERLLSAVAGRSGINSVRWIEQARFRRQYRVLLRDIARPDFRPDTRSIAVSRGMTVDEVNLALHRLLRLDLVEMRGAVWIALKEEPWEIR